MSKGSTVKKQAVFRTNAGELKKCRQNLRGSKLELVQKLPRSLRAEHQLV